MDISELIRIECIKSGNISIAELARRCGISPQNMHDRLKRNKWRIDDLEKIAVSLNKELSITFVGKSVGESDPLPDETEARR